MFSHILYKLGDTYNRIAFFLAFIAFLTHLNILTICKGGLISFSEFPMTHLMDRVNKISPLNEMI